MKVLSVTPAGAFSMICDAIAADKSISHRCAIFAMLSDKPSKIRNYLPAEDTLCTLQIIQQLGARVERDGAAMTITPPQKIEEPEDLLDCGNSGTAMRLLTGFLGGIDGHFVLTGDRYLRARPMRRVTSPLQDIGVKIDGRDAGKLAPLCIRGGNIKAFTYQSSIASAQVKSAMILAALKADAPCRYSEPQLSRDHSERMLTAMGARIEADESITIHPMTQPLEALDIDVPADPSSAFFFAVAAAIVPGGSVEIKNVTLNPTRIEAYRVLQSMGADITMIEKDNCYEPVGDIIVRYNALLKGVEVTSNIAWLIDELPALSIAMAVALGESVVANAAELRVKESDRIHAVIDNLQRCGIVCSETPDGYRILGGRLRSAQIDSYGDHRIAMSFAVAGALTSMTVRDTACIETSFPNFVTLLNEIAKVQAHDH